jgi:hypothetical protein
MDTGVQQSVIKREREMYNLVLKIEAMFRDGRLHEGIELFVFTDNVVTERAFYRGSSKSRRLFETGNGRCPVPPNHLGGRYPNDRARY